WPGSSLRLSARCAPPPTAAGRSGRRRTPARTAPGTARRASGPATSRSSACAELAHLDDDVLLPQLGQGAGGLLPGLGIADRLHVGVLLVGQQLALHVRRQGQVLGADR